MRHLGRSKRRIGIRPTSSFGRSGGPQLESFVFGEESCVSQSFVDVAGFDVRIGRRDRVTCLARGHQPKQSRHRKPKPANTGLAGADRGIDGNATKYHGYRIEGFGTSCQCILRLAACFSSGNAKLQMRRVGKGALCAVPTISTCEKMVGTPSDRASARPDGFAHPTGDSHSTMH
jgi:hypothetical protein